DPGDHVGSGSRIDSPAAASLLIHQALVVLLTGGPQVPAKEVPAERKHEHGDTDPDLEILRHHEPPNESLLLHHLVGNREQGSGNAPAEYASTPDERRPSHRARAFPPGYGLGASGTVDRHMDVGGS